MHDTKQELVPIDVGGFAMPNYKELLDIELNDLASLSVINLVDLIVERASAARASDIHLLFFG